VSRTTATAAATHPGAEGRDGLRPLRVEAVELRRVALPLVAPFRTSFGTQTVRDALLLRVLCGDTEGWGECVALSDPLYSSEYVDACLAVLHDHLLPRVLGVDGLTPAQVAVLLEPVHGHRMAKAAIEMAVLDAALRRARMSLATFLGATRTSVDCGVSVGIMDSAAELLDTVETYLAAGYRRIKLKIMPGWDVEPVRAVRERFGAALPLQVDANAAYALTDAAQLARLDEFDLLLIEQPLPEDDLRGHAALARRVRTPICLDESVVSARAAVDALLLGACSVVNIKPGRVGGYLEARRIHDVCTAFGAAVWCGGMLETGIGRAANVALAALPGFVLPGDTSSSDRYYAEDITTPLVMRDGRLPVPDAPGLGVEVDITALERHTVASTLLRATGLALS
jgi:O-succinylbenzoate synthase